MNTKINQLINYGLENQMISLYDVDYSINMLLDLFKLDCFERTTVEKIDYYLLIEDMLDYAVKVGLIEDNITERDLRTNKKRHNIFMIYQFIQIILEKRELIKILNFPIITNMEIFRYQLTYQNPKKILKK